MNARQGFIGQSVERREDSRFPTGKGQYTDDINLPGQSYAFFLRSPYAHAKITRLNVDAAAKAPGVLGIFAGEHFKAVGGLPCGWLINSLDGAATCRTTSRTTSWSPASTRTPSTTPATSPTPPAPTSARWRSTRPPAMCGLTA